MEVSELKNEGLQRQYRVVVPAADLEAKASARLAEMARSARLPGFRPGKVPVSHLKKLYGQQVMAEVIDQMIKESMDKVLSERDERPAYQPEIEVEGQDDQEKVNALIAGKADLAYTMTFEITPKVEVKDLSDIELTRYRVKVSDEDIDEAVKSISDQFRDYEDKDGAARKGDRVVISFVGRIDGEEFEGGSAEDVPLELGSGQFIPGFEDQLIGAKAGDEVLVKVTFPEEYGVEKLAGKEAEFTVRVKSVEAPVEAEIDDAFAQKLGMKDLAELREKVRAQAEAEMDKLAYTQLKRDVLDALDAQYDFEIPQRLVDAEFEQIWHSLEHQMKDEGRTFEDEGTTEEEARAEYRDIAARRVRLGLVLGTIGDAAGIAVTDEEMQQALIDKARQFPGQEKEVLEFYKKTPEALIELRGPIFEAKTIDHIVDQAKVTEKEITREEIERMLEEEDEKPEKKTSGKKSSTKKSATKKPSAKKVSAKKSSTKKSSSRKDAGKE